MNKYVYREDIEAEFDELHLRDALDDDRDDAEDEGLFESLASSIDAKVIAARDLVVSAGYPVPPEMFLRTFGRMAMCALLFRRRGNGNDVNPFAKSEKDLFEQLAQMAAGEIGTSSISIIHTTTPHHSFMKNNDNTVCDPTPILIMPDGKQYRMRGKYAGGVVSHYWEEVK